MARRRSARLAGGAKASKKNPAVDLEPVTEREMSPVNDVVQSGADHPAISSPLQPPQTPLDRNLSSSRQSPSSALRLGFTDIKPKNSSAPGIGPHQSTPSKSNLPSSSPFGFQFNRNNVNTADSTLGPEAQRMMNEIRVEAAKIKAELAAKRDQERLEEEQVNTRKIAQPKGKAGRYSEIHMAEFKKMDSIANHPSAFRAMPARATPAAAAGNSKGIKRSQSKANLDDDETPSGQDSSQNFRRARQHVQDDASTNRPVSRDGSNIPRPKTPGKDSRVVHRPRLLHEGYGFAICTQNPSKVSLSPIKKSVTIADVNAGNPTEAQSQDAEAKVRSASLSAKVRSFLTKHKAPATSSNPGILKSTVGASQTPAPARAKNELPPAPFTTPGKRMAQRGDFTPVPKHAALAQNSPSPVKGGIPRSEASNNVVNYPSLDTVMEGTAEPASMTTAPSPGSSMKAPVAVPGTFSFRSDHTISFDSESPKGFGAKYGQASVRQVRSSIMPPMPGAFPTADTAKSSDSHGKENVPPYMQRSFDPKAFSHGVSSKKRYRVEDDEQEAEREAAERAAKKQKNAAVPEGEALMAPRLAGAQRVSPFRSPSKASPEVTHQVASPRGSCYPGSARKTTGISKSRLAYLAQPKLRK
ncbi:hypothetical protein OPQ81_008069 [Rhizoctonia solani]|nr:hypothetical protein OPQ81_008069 [Rhizoctonia solani]